MAKTITIDTLFSANVANLNRDDLGQVKSAIVGGTNRLRVSSQCLKRHIRQNMTSDPATLTRELPIVLRSRLLKEGYTDKDISKVYAEVFVSNKKKGSLLDQKTGRLKAIFMFSEAEIEFLYNDVLKPLLEGESIPKKKFADLLNPSEENRYGAVVSLFGRMFADDPAVSVEAAASFSHAVTVHEAYGQKDYFTALDDYSGAAEGEEGSKQGAGHLDTQEFGSGIYHSCVQINLDLLSKNLGLEEGEDAKQLVEEFLKSVLTSFPQAKRTGMLSKTLPFYVCARVTEGQAPVLSPAFISACAPDRGAAIRAIQAELGGVEDWEGFAFTTLATVEYYQGSQGSPASLVDEVLGYV